MSEWREFPSAPCLAGKKKLEDSSRLVVVEIARVPDMLSSLFLSCSGYGLISTPLYPWSLWNLNLITPFAAIVANYPELVHLCL